MRFGIHTLKWFVMPVVFMAAAPSDFTPSDGTPIALKDRGFSITPPKGWEYRTDLPNLSLVMQAPKEKGASYQKSIQVMVRNTPVSIDETTAVQFEAELTKVFGKSMTSITDFHIRNHELVEIADGRKAILYYTGMKLDGFDLMQIHVVASSDTKHFIATYTDLAEFFDKGTDSPALMTAWSSLSSLQFEGAAPQRFETPIRLFGIVGAIIMIGIIFSVGRTVLATLRYRRLSNSMDGDGASEDDGDTESDSTEDFSEDLSEDSLDETTSPTGTSFGKSKAPGKSTGFSAGFSGKSEVTKASRHAVTSAPLTEDASMDDDWNLGDTNPGSKVG